jgi:hypothetical protein
VYQPTARLYTGQEPAKNKYDDNALYGYATIRNRLAACVHQKNQTPTLSILNGPMNSFEKYLIDDVTRVARWKYNTRSRINEVWVIEPGHDIGLILCLVILADLIDWVEQMNKHDSNSAWLIAG